MTESSESGPIAFRVNAGGSPYTDHEGRSWKADKGYHRGSWGCLSLVTSDILSTTDPISNTDEPALFQTIRVGEELRHRFDVSAGIYRVLLLFAEIYWESSDAEAQDVTVGGKKVLRSFNIFDDASHDAALEKRFTAEVTQGSLELHFVGVSLPMHSGARVCGIEVEGSAQVSERGLADGCRGTPPVRGGGTVQRHPPVIGHTATGPRRRLRL